MKQIASAVKCEIEAISTTKKQIDKVRDLATGQAPNKRITDHQNHR